MRVTGYRLWFTGYGLKSLELSVYRSRIERVKGLGFRVSGLGFRV